MSSLAHCISLKLLTTYPKRGVLHYVCTFKKLRPKSLMAVCISTQTPPSRKTRELLTVMSHPPPSLSAEAQRRPYYADYSPVRKYIHTLCTSHYLDLFITFIIGVNVITMSMEHFNQPKVKALRLWSLGKGAPGSMVGHRLHPWKGPKSTSEWDASFSPFTVLYVQKASL